MLFSTASQAVAIPPKSPPASQKISPLKSRVTTALPWIGRKVGRQAMADFMRDLTEPLAFEVEDILAAKPGR